MEVIAEVEDLERTLGRFPGLTRAQLGTILQKKQLSLPFATDSAPADPVPGPDPDPALRAPLVHSPPGSIPGPVSVWSDGASRGNPGPAAIGVLIRDSSGRVVEEVAAKVGVKTNNFAEYEAVRTALERARELGANQVTLHADSELVVKQLNGAYRVKHPDLKPLYDAVKALERAFPKGVRYLHVRRELNREADALANRGLDEDGA